MIECVILKCFRRHAIGAIFVLRATVVWEKIVRTSALRKNFNVYRKMLIEQMVLEQMVLEQILLEWTVLEQILLEWTVLEQILSE